MAKLKTIIDWCIKHDFILNTHHDNTAYVENQQLNIIPNIIH